LAIWAIGLPENVDQLDGVAFELVGELASVSSVFSHKTSSHWCTIRLSAVIDC
jgi:hypothetical protein